MPTSHAQWEGKAAPGGHALAANCAFPKETLLGAGAEALGAFPRCEPCPPPCLNVQPSQLGLDCPPSVPGRQEFLGLQGRTSASC